MKRQERRSNQQRRLGSGKAGKSRVWLPGARWKNAIQEAKVTDWVKCYRSVMQDESRELATGFYLEMDIIPILR